MSAIGTPVRATLWYVVWQHDALDAKQGEATKLVSGESYVATADPSGSDLFEIARGAVLNGKASGGHGFTIVVSKRLAEVKGTAITAGGAN